MNSTLLDLRQVEHLILIGRMDYLDLLGDVMRDVPLHLESIRSAIQEGDITELQARAHNLRGMISYFGCAAMAARLARLELHETIAPDQARAVHTELQSIWEQSLAAIKQWEKTIPEFA